MKSYRPAVFAAALSLAGVAAEAAVIGPRLSGEFATRGSGNPFPQCIQPVGQVNLADLIARQQLRTATPAVAFFLFAKRRRAALGRRLEPAQ